MELTSDNQNLSLPTYQAGLIQAKAYRSLNAFLSGFLSMHNLSTSEWGLFGLVADNQHQRISELAIELGVEVPRVSKIVDKLEGTGLVERVTDAVDSRVRTVSVTDFGKQRVAEIEKALRREMKLFLHDISLPELAVYMTVLNKIATKLND